MLLLLKKLPSRYLLLAAALVLGVLGWQFCHYTPDNPAALSRAQRRQVNADIKASQQGATEAATRGDAALAAGERQRATSAAHAAHAIYYHQQARHARYAPLPATSAAAEQLRRQLTGHE